MKILIITQYFWPEEFLINDFAISLSSMGHEVEVLTGLPNYPSGNFFRGYNYCGPYREVYESIPVWRSPLIRRGNSSNLRLALNYLSFAISAGIRGLLNCRRPFDIILVFEVSPITVGIPARIMKALLGAKLYFWVQDLWPESLSATGAIHSGRIIDGVGLLTRWIYKGCDRILIQSQAFRESVIKYGAEEDQLCYFPNYIDGLYKPMILPAEAPERKLMPSGFLVMFAGNIGTAQDFETIMTAAELTRSQSEIQWVIVGDGRQRRWLEHEVQRKALTNVTLIGHHPPSKMPAFFSLADVMLVSLKSRPIFSLTIPSKLQAYLACGKPIIASLDGEGARIVEEAHAGLAVPAESPYELANAVRHLAAASPVLLQAMGSNARTYYERHFSRQYLLGVFEEWLTEENNSEDNKE